MFRLTHDTLETVDELADAGLALHIVDLQGEPVDTSSAIGRFFLTIMAALAEMERGLISERTQMGMDQLKKTHKKFTQSIFGWDVDETGALKPNWTEQDIIDYMVWQVKINGMSLTQVARSLNLRGIKGKRGGKWQGSSVKRVIENKFHRTRLMFPQPQNWGSKPWHRRQ
jgi:DNA invertase Pin-like site-specific DNA recombinase